MNYLLPLFSQLLTHISKNKIDKNNTEIIKEDKELSQKKRKSIALWDKTTISLPNLQKIYSESFEAIYFTTFLKDKTELTALKAVAKDAEIHDWKYKTSDLVNLQMYLLFAVEDCKLRYHDINHIVLFTKSEELYLKLKIQAHAVGIFDIERSDN